MCITKKKNARNNYSSQQSSNSGPSPTKDNSDDRETKTSKKKTTKPKSKSNKGQSPAPVESEKDKSFIAMNLHPMGARLAGHVFHKKPEPKDFTRRILQSERPDLVAPDSQLTTEECHNLDELLLNTTELQDNSQFLLGTVSNINDQTDDDEDENMKCASVLMLYDHGRFGNIHTINVRCMPDDETNEDEEKDKDNSKSKKTKEVQQILKVGRRMNANARIEHEIAILRCFYPVEQKRKEGEKGPTHITPIIANGDAGGSPYFTMPVMDVNLERLKQQIGHKFRWVDSFYIGQESMIGIKECHDRSIIHRDIKPTNLLLCREPNMFWWLCDFGDSCRIGEVKIISPPDALTLPYLSRAAHEATQKPMKATIAMDIESWFYMLLDLFVVLPWKNMVEEAPTLAAKTAFWANLTEFFQKRAAKLPPQLLPIAQIVGNSSIEKPYIQLKTILRDGFDKNNAKQPWKPDWITKRTPPKASAEMARSKEKGSIPKSNESASQTSDAKSKNQKKSPKNK